MPTAAHFSSRRDHASARRPAWASPMLGARRSAAALAGLAALGVALLAVPAAAQTPAGNSQTPAAAAGTGGTGADTGVSAMGTRPDPSTTVVHEGSEKKSADSNGTHRRRGATNRHRDANGATGFHSGLYGTGAGSNK